MTEIEVTRGDSAIILGLPHTGTEIPPHVWDVLNGTGKARADTDWHVDRLYDGLLPGATTVRTPIHRYAIDVNRDPAGVSLYPGQNTTSLCPLTDFEGRPIYRAGQEPDAHEIARRVAAHHRPYHAALAGEIARVKALHGVAILYDCHSIRSRIPYLFDGTLPDLNVGTNNGETCHWSIEATVSTACTVAKGYSSVLNGRFKGGWTTRHYGQPQDGVHAIQMEFAQSSYLTAEAEPWAYDVAKAERLRALLRHLLETLDFSARKGQFA
ncbi:MAG: N-formylglutamate deformylase [Pseudomonadota bacterium]